MANKKISDILASNPAAAITGAEPIETVQSAATVAATVDQVAAYIRRVAINAQSGTTYTFVLADAGKAVRGTNASAQTYTIPANATTAFGIGDSIAIRQVGAGAITVTPAGGVTLNIPTGYIAKTGRVHATIMIHKVGTNEWDITGDLST